MGYGGDGAARSVGPKSFPSGLAEALVVTASEASDATLWQRLIHLPLGPARESLESDTGPSEVANRVSLR